MAGTDQRHVEAELLAPVELDAALAEAPVAYLPLGSLEFHSAHLPIGLDALNAHGLCILTAQRIGGIVLPPLYQGAGGGHSDYPWTIMMASSEGIRKHLEHTLRRLETFGVRLAVLFTGHFADEQMAMIDGIAAEWQSSGRHTMDVMSTGVNRSQTAPIAPDHAGVFETSLLHSLRPELVHLDRLPSRAHHPSIDPGGDEQGAHRHEPSHPLWGVFGPDPRDLDLHSSGVLRDALVAWLSSEVTRRLDSPDR
jgi:creatinine amidohydrolase